MKLSKAILAKISIALLVMGLASGPAIAKRYKQPDSGAASATLVITKSQAEIESPSSLEPTRQFSVYEDSSCVKKDRRTFLGVLFPPSNDMLSGLLGSKNESSKEFRVAADQPLYVKVTSRLVLDSRRQSYKVLECANLVSFTPVEGHRYEASQLSRDNRCLLMVIDSGLGQIPEDFEIVPIAGACHDN